MRNILLISSIYPIPEKNYGTKVCHYFAKDWVKMGYNVQSVHIQTVFPRIFYWIASLFRDRIAAKTGAVVYTKRDKGGFYEMDGVPVMRTTVFKLIPHRKATYSSVKQAAYNVLLHNAKINFVPDYIVAHFSNPQLELLDILKKEYPFAKTALVMHGDVCLTRKVYGSDCERLMANVDVWGFRSKTIKEEFEKEFFKVDKSFICYSGIPEDFIAKENNRSFIKPPSRFIYVGEMIDRKYPVKVFEALHLSYPDHNFHLDYVGNGTLTNAILHFASENGLTDCVSINGRIPREQILEKYDSADCFIMISRSEAYGLVYLEAMARGCITIASRKEGFDGIIEDGVNGFLCNAGDEIELANIIERIIDLSPEERKQISLNAWETAKTFTDYLAAKSYINKVKELTGN